MSVDFIMLAIDAEVWLAGACSNAARDLPIQFLFRGVFTVHPVRDFHSVGS